MVSALVLSARRPIEWPLYLLRDNAGHDYHERQYEDRDIGKRNGPDEGVNYFSPASPLFKTKVAEYIVSSSLGLGLMAVVLYRIARACG